MFLVQYHDSTKIIWSSNFELSKTLLLVEHEQLSLHVNGRAATTWLFSNQTPFLHEYSEFTVDLSASNPEYVWLTTSKRTRKMPIYGVQQRN